MDDVLLLIQLIEGAGLASVACYLSMYLDVHLPRDMVFLGEVRFQGGLYHPMPMDVHYLDFCLKKGFRRVVGRSERLHVLRERLNEDPYRAIELIELSNARELVPKVFEKLRQAALVVADDDTLVVLT